VSGSVLESYRVSKRENDDTDGDGVPPESREGRVLVVGPGPLSRGGISAVLATHQLCGCWDAHRCIWVETMQGGNYAAKLITALKAFGRAAGLIPRAEIVHIHMALGASLYRKCAFFLLARLINRTTIVQLHSPDQQFIGLMEGSPSISRMLCAWMLRNADRVVALSVSWERLIRKYIPEARTCCVPNPYWLPPDFHSAKRNGHTVLYLNRIESRKGYEHLLRAIPQVLERCPKARFVMAGHGDIALAKRLAADLGVAHAIEFPGWVEGNRKWGLLAAADILCLPSFSEGVPIAMLEAMAAGVAVVTTPVGGIPDLVQDGVNGMLVRPGDVDGIAASLTKLLIESDLRSRLSDAARRMVQMTNSLPVVDSRLRHLYADALTVREMLLSKVAPR
jgi:glycosyltransferase involved in cell wall biosynthesis